MEEIFRNGFLDKPVTKHKESSGVKREDVDLLVSIQDPIQSAYLTTPGKLQVHELEITRPQAEKLLMEKNGDLKHVLQSWIEPTV